MAWNTPGSSSGGSGNNGNRNNSWKPRNRQGGGIGDVVERLRGLFGGAGGGGNPLRWVLLGIGILVLFSSFQLIGEQQRGVVLRFGQFDRIMQPGPNFKLPWPVESVTKVNATADKVIIAIVQDPDQRGAEAVFASLKGLTPEARKLLGQ